MTRNVPNDHQPSTASPFHRLLAAHAVSQVGSGVTALALPLIAAVTLGATPFQVGLLAAAETGRGIDFVACGQVQGRLPDDKPWRLIPLRAEVRSRAAEPASEAP